MSSIAVNPRMPGYEHYSAFIMDSAWVADFYVCGTENYLHEQLKVVSEVLLGLKVSASRQKLNKIRTMADAVRGCEVSAEASQEIDALITDRDSLLERAARFQPIEVPLDERDADVILYMWDHFYEVFRSLGEKQVYLCKRNVNKLFTEFVLRMQVGRRINSVVIWEYAGFASHLISRLANGKRFSLVAVGSYSLVCRFATDRPSTAMERIAVEKFEGGTDLDLKIIGQSEEDHAELYERILASLYSDQVNEATFAALMQGSPATPFSGEVFDALEGTDLQFHGWSFNHFPQRQRENFFIARRQEEGAPVDIKAMRLDCLDPRVSLSASHIVCEHKEFVVFRFKYTRKALATRGHVLQAKVCFLDLSICREYDSAYTCNAAPHDAGRYHAAASAVVQDLELGE